MVEIGIPEFYGGQDVFITGATGFVGKVLVEKLLRSCPDIRNIYILIRAARGKSAQERWDELTKLPLFDLLKEQRPNALSTKVKVLDGDVSKEFLGLLKEDYKLIENNASVIFHAAANVRFNEPLHEAVRLNTYGTLQVVNLALKMKKIKAFVHISTAYSNCQMTEVEEKIYPSMRDWREVIKISEKTDPEVLTILTDKYLSGLPNTYVFTKSLAENIVWEVRDQIPVVIFRPTIVISSWKEPLRGWIDNFNGPVGLLVGGGKGVVRTIVANPNAMADFTLVDVAIKAVIVSAWKRATSLEWEDKDLIYNCATTYKNITNEELVRMTLEAHERNPMAEIMWYPKISVNSSIFLHRIQALYKHLLPAIIIDTLLRLMGKKPMLLKIQIKVHTAVVALSYFLLRYWKFHNENFLRLIKEIPPKDREAFDYDFIELVPIEYFENSAMVGGKKFLLKEENVDPVMARRKYFVFKYVHYGLLTSIRLGLLWALYKFYSLYEFNN